jgi:hypothetical protein
MTPEGDEKARSTWAARGARWHAMDRRRSTDLYHISAKQKLVSINKSGQFKFERKLLVSFCDSALSKHIILA